MKNEQPEQTKGPDFEAKLRGSPEGRALEAEYAKFMSMGKQVLPDVRREYEEMEGEMEKAYDLADAAVKRLSKKFQRFYPEDLNGLDLNFAASIIAQARGKRKKEGGDEEFPPELDGLETKALKLCQDYLKVHDHANRTYKEMEKLRYNLNPNKSELKRAERSRKRLEKKRRRRGKGKA